MDFITGAEIAEKIRYVCAGENVRVACAFWGRSIAADLFPSPRTDAFVVFNHMLGGTTHAAASHLRDTLGDRVRAHPTLHAKVFASARGAVIGSANASINGFGGFHEAGVWLAPEEDDFQAAFDYPKTLLNGSLPVDNGILEICRISFEFKRVGAMTADLADVKSNSLRDAILSNSEHFHLPFVITSDEVDSVAAGEDWENNLSGSLPGVAFENLDPYEIKFVPELANAKRFISLHTWDNGRTVRVGIQQIVRATDRYTYCRYDLGQLPGVEIFDEDHPYRHLNEGHGLGVLFKSKTLYGDRIAGSNRAIRADDLAVILAQEKSPS